MNAFDHLQAICQAMARPGFYPHPVETVQRIDTHISTVFLTGDWVYKLKKPVYLGFLDFRQLSQRKHFCEQEVVLNQRLSHDIYQGVVDILETDDGHFSLQGSGRVVEYAVKMRRLPDAAGLKALLQERAIDPKRMETLAHTMADFYKGGQRNSDIDYFGRPDVISYNMEENFRQLDPYVGSLLDQEKWDFLCQVSRTFLDHHRDVFERRVTEGYIRDGHGDLRTDHIYFHPGPQIIDCIEFNDRFRYGDAAVDLAFLYMDLEHLGHPEWARFFISAYAGAAQDPRLYTVIDFYAAYRAVVRLKVDAFRYPDAQPGEQETLKQDIHAYLQQAYRYAIQFGRPTLWILCGLPATGKSLVAETLSDVLSIERFSSDRLRKTAGISGNGRTAFGQGAYRMEWRHKVYTRLLAHGHETLKAGHSVILDATFSRRKWRDEARRLAADLDTNLIFAETVCNEATIRSRLKSRESTSGLSDARLEHLPDMLENFEPLTETPTTTHFQVSSENPPEAMLVETLFRASECKHRQVSRLLEAQGRLGNENEE